MKSQSDIWKGPHLPRAQKVHCQKSKIKELMIFAYDNSGVIASNQLSGTLESLEQITESTSKMSCIQKSVNCVQG